MPDSPVLLVGHNTGWIKIATRTNWFKSLTDEAVSGIGGIMFLLNKDTIHEMSIFVTNNRRVHWKALSIADLHSMNDLKYPQIPGWNTKQCHILRGSAAVAFNSHCLEFSQSPLVKRVKDADVYRWKTSRAYLKSCPQQVMKCHFSFWVYTKGVLWDVCRKLWCWMNSTWRCLRKVKRKLAGA